MFLSIFKTKLHYHLSNAITFEIMNSFWFLKLQSYLSNLWFLKQIQESLKLMLAKRYFITLKKIETMDSIVHLSAVRSASLMWSIIGIWIFYLQWIITHTKIHTTIPTNVYESFITGNFSDFVLYFDMVSLEPLRGPSQWTRAHNTN